MLSNLVRRIITRPTVEEPKAWSFIAEADRLLQKETSYPPPAPDEIFRSSGLSKMCPREEVLRYIHQVNRVEKIDAKLQRIFDFGNAFNDLAQNKWFGEWKWLVGDWRCKQCSELVSMAKKPDRCGCGSTGFNYQELEFSDPILGYSGHPDGILENQGRQVLELKTCNSKIYQYLTEIIKGPFDYHVDQVSLYMHHYGIPNGTIVYLNKDTAEWIEFPQVLNPRRVEKLMEKIKTARQGMLRKEVPPNEMCATSDCVRAKRCSVRSKCFEKPG